MGLRPPAVRIAGWLIENRATVGRCCALAATLALCSCETRAPSINVLGAFFPAWMLCIVAGIALALVARFLLAASGLDPWLGPRGVIYPALALAFTLATWVVFFQS